MHPLQQIFDEMFGSTQKRAGTSIAFLAGFILSRFVSFKKRKRRNYYK